MFMYVYLFIYLFIYILHMPYRYKIGKKDVALFVPDLYIYDELGEQT